MSRQGLMDDSGYMGFEECSRYEECSKECFERFMHDENVPSQTYQQGRAEGRKEAILYVRKLIKIFWKDWNNTSHKRLPYLAFEELDEHILEQADESNGREFMQWYKEQSK